jgi:carboxypeptidase C (cathepsin A)
MLYIDQPIGAGFSYGDETVGTSDEAAKDLWKFMQIFLKDSRFQKYANHSLGLWGESYGGHYGLFFLFINRPEQFVEGIHPDSANNGRVSA